MCPLSTDGAILILVFRLKAALMNLTEFLFYFVFSLILVPKGIQIHLGRLTFLKKGFFEPPSDRQTDRQTDNAKTITPSADVGCNKLELYNNVVT